MDTDSAKRRCHLYMYQSGIFLESGNQNNYGKKGTTIHIQTSSRFTSSLKVEMFEYIVLTDNHI